MDDTKAARVPGVGADDHMDNNLNNQLLDSVPDGVFTVDAEWRITSFNHAVGG